jgi:hypothetical protein
MALSTLIHPKQSKQIKTTTSNINLNLLTLVGDAGGKVVELVVVVVEVDNGDDEPLLLLFAALLLLLFAVVTAARPPASRNDDGLTPNIFSIFAFQ